MLNILNSLVFKVFLGLLLIFVIFSFGSAPDRIIVDNDTTEVRSSSREATDRPLPIPTEVNEPDENFDLRPKDSDFSVNEESEESLLVEVVANEPEKIEMAREENTMMDLINLIIPISPIQISEKLSFTEINSRTREAIVNILCTTKQGGLLQPITGSGVVVDPRGIILTNAHIAQYFLLKDYLTENFLNCTIRTGSPAVNAYRAEILFISPSWIRENFRKIIESNPKGTGEHDYAFLLITEVYNPANKLPQEFSYITPDIRGTQPLSGDLVIVAGYPAGFLGGISIQKNLHILSTITDIVDIFTFGGENTLDLFSTGGNVLAQKGASGGAVVSETNKLLGIVVTATEAVQTSDRDLRAISLFHIDQSLKNDSGFDIEGLFFGELRRSVTQFNEILAPTLKELLITALEG